MSAKKTKKIFSIRYKLMLIFGFIMLLSTSILTIIAITDARSTVMERVEKQLIAQAKDSAKFINRNINANFEKLETLSRALFQGKGVDFTHAERAFILENDAKSNPNIKGLYEVDNKGNAYYLDNGELKTVNILDREYFQKSIKGEKFFSAPYYSKLDENLIITASIPVYDENNKILGVLIIDYEGFGLSSYIEDIEVGETGAAYILDKAGVTIAHPDKKVVLDRVNAIEKSKNDSTFKQLAEFQKKVLQSNETNKDGNDEQHIDFYQYKGKTYIAAYAKIDRTDWTVVIRAPREEFLDNIERLQRILMFVGLAMAIGVIILIYIMASRIAKPLQTTAKTLKNIAQGDGDLTARLPIISNDEVTEVSRYFNETINKINVAIRSVMSNAGSMEKIGQMLSTNMTETASSVNQIAANIEGVKEQVFSQSQGVSETSATMEEIIQTIHQLDVGIGNQVQTINDLNQIIDESNITTAETRNILSKNDELIEELVDESSKGQNVIHTSQEEVQKILEESGSLLEASSIIENIASQTNLLAMNAAIEAAHAGDAGKGFAVVADEIRKLAEESSSQAKVITAALKNLSSEIQTVSSSSINIGESFESIFNKVQQVKLRSAGIMRIAGTRKKQSESLLALIQKVDGVTNEVKAGSAEMLRGGNQVADEMRKLDELTRIITGSMNEMASGAAQINKAVQEVNELSQQNNESIKNLSDEVNKFKV